MIMQIKRLTAKTPHLRYLWELKDRYFLPFPLPRLTLRGNMSKIHYK